MDYLVFESEKDPDPLTDIPLYVIEETKTTPSESRNVSVFQRTAKFVTVEQYQIMKSSEKIMFYTFRRPYKTYPPTFTFGIKAMKTLGLSIEGIQDDNIGTLAY